MERTTFQAGDLGKEEGLDMGEAFMRWKVWIGANGKSNLENQIWKDLNALKSTKE